MTLTTIWNPAAVASGPPQLNYSLGNPGAPGTIYVSANPADNQLTLAMSSTVSAGFTPGTLVPPEQAQSGGGSLLYLDLTPLGLTQAEFNGLSLVADGWTYALYSGSSGQLVGFTPTAPVSLPPAPTSILFALDNFTMAQQPGASASLTLLAYRVTGISGNFPVSGNISVVFALPDDNKGNLIAAMQVGLTPAQVVNSLPQYPTIENQLTLTMTQQPNAPTINAGADTVFTLSFVYASDTNGFGALLTIAEGMQVQVTAAEGTTGWTITPHLNADPPFWTLVPPPNQPLFTTGAGSTLAIDIGNLVTAFQPGPTVALLGYSDVPGYKNGSFAITLLKEPHVVISSFGAELVPPYPGPGQPSNVLLTWTISYATQLTLVIGGEPVDVTGKTSYPYTFPAKTLVSLTAVGDCPGGADNRAIATQYPPPVLQTVLFDQNFPGNTTTSEVYTEAGLSFSNNCGNYWASPFVNNFVGTYGSPSSLFVAATDGGTFGFISLQVCDINTAINPQTTTFIGTRPDGTTVRASFSTPNADTTPQTFAPPGFTNLQSLTVELGFVAFDNLVFVA